MRRFVWELSFFLEKMQSSHFVLCSSDMNHSTLLNRVGLTSLSLAFLTFLSGAMGIYGDEGKTGDVVAKDASSATDLTGKWKIVSVESDGEKKTGSEITMSAVRFDKTKLYLGEGEFSFVMNYKVDSSKSPHPVVLSIASSPFGADETPHAGLVAREGDRLKLIYGMPGETAPVAFKAPAGKRYRNMVLELIK